MLGRADPPRQRRPDGTRLIAGIPATEDQWREKSPIFSALNTNKKSLTLDFQTECGRELLRRLIPTCDVIGRTSPAGDGSAGLDFDWSARCAKT
jgi:crotonobetainyl-CoA:carnitine CoA-transferase CaiB-like acyl-CoA transferase